MSKKRTPEEELAFYKEKARQAQAKLTAAKKKEDTHRKIVAGGWLNSVEPIELSKTDRSRLSDEYIDRVVEKLVAMKKTEQSKEGTAAHVETKAEEEVPGISFFGNDSLF